MTPDEQPSPKQTEAANDYVDALLAGRRPRPPREIAGDEGDALRMAAFLSSAETHQAQPSAAFVEHLRARLAAPQRRSWLDFRLTRRGMARGLIGGVAAVAACLVGGQAFQRLRGEPVPGGWVPIARAAELTPGSVKRFVAGELEGHVMNIGGKIWALSAICTHMPCVLDWRGQNQEFQCACHEAGRFDVSGQQMGVDEYKQPLPPLPKIPVQQRNGVIYVVT